jgi:MerR family transcriptional regulator, light-induced transcriptional regulator
MAAERATDELESLDLAAAAERLGVHYQTAYQWVRNGSLPAARVRGRYRIDAAALDEFARQRDEPHPIPTRARPRRWDQLAARFERCLLDGREGELRRMTMSLHDQGVPITELLRHLFVPALRAIGDGWVAGAVTIPEEHRASAMIGRLLGELDPNPRGRRRGRVVVAALSGDQHDLPTALAAAALREDRWNVEHLGSDMPSEEVIRFANQVDADLVVLTVTNLESTADAARTQRRLERAGRRTIVGRPGSSLDDLVEAARANSPAARHGT